MLDPKQWRADPNAVGLDLLRRGFALDAGRLTALDTGRREHQVRTEALQAERNRLSKQVGVLKRAGEDTAALIEQVGVVGEQLQQSQAALDSVRDELDDLLLEIPNIPDAEVPDGLEVSCNRELRHWGTIPQYDFTPADHLVVGEPLGLDIETAATMSGSRFALLHGDMATLHRALIQFMLDMHLNEHGYTEVYAPVIVQRQALIGTGQLPKLAGDMFALDKGRYLIPTGEVPLVNIARDRIFEPGELPLRLVTHTPCFRSEAGSYGRDTRGIIRQHQFEKVELVHLVSAGCSETALESLTADAEAVLRQLELPYRVMELCCGDMGFSAARTLDLEVWLPGQGTYREISSCSNTRDFQARRMQARERSTQGEIQYIHTLNGSGLAVGRTLVAILENYQRADGSLVIPGSLRPYIGGREMLIPNGRD